VPLSGKSLSLVSSVVSSNLTQCLRHFVILLLRRKKEKKKLSLF
jgi:hypothetical protein